MTTPTKERLAEKLADTIYEHIASALFRARERLRIFADLRIRPIVTVDPETGAPSFSFDAGYPRQDVDATIERLLELPGQLAAERKRKVALVFDEFQEVVDIDPDLPKLMRSVFQEQPEVAHVYLGSKRHMMERIFNDENEPFWRSARQMELGVIDPPRFEGYLATSFERTGKKIAPETIAAVLETTGGHPYATQELCYFLWEETPKARVARLADYERALADVLRAEHAHFELIWDQASSGQRLTLCRLSRTARTPAERRLPPPSQAAGSIDRPTGTPGADPQRARHSVRQRVPDRGAVPGRLAPRPGLTHPCVTRPCVIPEPRAGVARTSGDPIRKEPQLQCASSHSSSWPSPAPLFSQQ